MTEEGLQHPQHLIQVAARRSGLSTRVIRARERRYQAVALSITYPADDTRLPDRQLRLRAQGQPGEPGEPIFAGGAAVGGYKRALEQIGAVLPDSLAEFDRDPEALRRAGD